MDGAQRSKNFWAGSISDIPSRAYFLFMDTAESVIAPFWDVRRISTKIKST
jgi:hypothetical protein